MGINRGGNIIVCALVIINSCRPLTLHKKVTALRYSIQIKCNCYRKFVTSLLYIIALSFKKNNALHYSLQINCNCYKKFVT